MCAVNGQYKFFTRFILLAVLAFVLNGCGGGSGGGAGVSKTLSGTAATGAAIDGIVSVYGINGGVVEVPVAASGVYSADVTGLTPPFCVCAVPNDSGLATQYSYAPQSGTANVTPLTTLALFYANDEQDPANLIAAWPASAASVIAAAPSAQATVNANFVGQFSSVDFTTYDFLTSPFSIGDTFDQILDLLNIDISSGAPVITVNGAPYTFNPNIDVSGINIGGSTLGSGSGQLTIAGLTPSTFVPINSAFSDNGNISAIAWTSADISTTVAAGLLNGVVVSVQVTHVNDDFSADSWIAGGLLQAVPGASFDGTTLTLTNVIASSLGGSASPPALTLNGSISK